ncbi:hypothetical protein EDB82DRAFT_494488 [Fusarium venenatum]|uniref:uncharacterized protein n=1 Tax=Fusarium venenatum TaxID=56646 RepID=UPI001DA73368|nr:hypothetical protein EDB82DRAFT_494488 [Fusarium venenatum]
MMIRIQRGFIEQYLLKICTSYFLTSKHGTPANDVIMKIRRKQTKVRVPSHDPKTINKEARWLYVWWFNESILADGQLSLCRKMPRRIPDDQYITFSCRGEGPRIVSISRDLLYSFVRSTMYRCYCANSKRTYKEIGTMPPAEYHSDR